MMKFRPIYVFLLAAFLLLAPNLFGQIANYKALYIYNFIKRIEWPVSEIHPDNFYLVVYGDKKTAKGLQQIAETKKAGNRNIVVLQIEDISEIENADLIYVGNSKRKEVESIASRINASPVLLVADHKNAETSDINLIESADGLEFVIRPEAIRSKGLKLSDSLIQLGKEEDD